jgi:hypothetical protein
MKPEQDFGADKPERLAVDSKSNLWAIQGEGQCILNFTSDGKPRSLDVPLPRCSVATALGFDPAGGLLVTDNGPRQQVLVFDVTVSPAKLVDTFGEEGGTYKESQRGRCGPLPLAGPTGAGFDSVGNSYLVCNLLRGRTVIWAYSPKRQLRLELLGLEFVDVADVRPGSDGSDVFTAANRYQLDPSAPAGKGWRWLAHTVL